MPNYLYKCDNDHSLWHFEQNYKNRPKKLVCPTCEADMLWEMGANTPPSGCYPYYSDAMGVGSDQVGEAAKSLCDAGIPTQFDKEGSLLVESRQHRNQVMGHLGLYDRQAGYGDRTPQPVERVKPDLPSED